MPTNALGPGTKNRTLNLSESLDFKLSKLAYESNVSISAYLKTLAAEAVNQGRIISKESVKVVTESTVCLFILLGLGAILPASVLGTDVIRPRSNGSAARIVRLKTNRRNARDDYFFTDEDGNLLEEEAVAA
ncbi:hypothetical protein [Rubellicoccus peritrichatus]|uniref:Uncharacterized protein n=1 Tax=Rubellicoccus peritrichatus TaxID=3080537 RepID=A0AAQ3L9R8_9BACT|nr:hypothetical protein [Puniceicoccus sp. CR14]WOO40406.1 hypothetical protein RZN69_17440 [Puniceicoccus sp. CR14]WOO40455.1 hypothetical protein RZN69_17685 [Puniceicoccus sp. CR14]WOO40504.1 hypothetical protein RZN69_17930 [Puniceicoccus sp. CR14]WOO40554.1 hypothetical protein RZN69_18180 [Puniceicoccus sp. CR14]